MTGACEGIRVVELAGGMAGPLATMILGENGADVVKVEPPEGDWARDEPGFAFWNRTKRGVVADLRTPEGRALAGRLAATADVVVEALGPGVAERAGLGYAAVAAANPDVVYCSIAAAPGAVLGDVKGYEALVSAATGRMVGLDSLSGAVPGQVRDAPIYTAAPIGSYGAAQLAVQGILAALLARRAGGGGQRVETSVLEGAIAFLMREELARDGGHEAAHLRPEAYRGIQLCFLTAECHDGRYIQMCARQDHHFRAWLTALGLADLLETPTYANAPLGVERMEDLDALEEMLRSRMKERTQAEWMAVFTEQFDVGADPFLTPEEFLAHPQIVENGRVVELVDPRLGPTRQLGPLVAFDATPSVVDRPAPRLGQHTDEVVAELTAAPPTRVAVDRSAVPAGRPPLAGVTVLELAYMIAGPFATSLLAELGARVIKVEPFEGDPYRRIGLQATKFLHGKESIALDLKSDGGRRILEQLVERSDALVHSFRPGVAERLGFGAADALARNPRLVYLHAASYGSRGPQAHRAAFHSTPSALAGGGILQAGRGNPPVDDSYPDAGSAIAAATALLLGLHARALTGAGQRLETTMLCSTGYILSEHMVVHEGARPLPLPDREQHGLHARYRLYPCQEGWLFLAAPREDEWRAATEVLGHPEWADRRADDDDLIAAIGACLLTRSAAAWAGPLAAAGVGAAVVHPATFERWLIDNGLVVAAEHPDYGSYWRPPAKVRLSSALPDLRPLAGLGEHTRPLLLELGYDADAIDGLVAAGVVQERARVAEAHP